MAIPGHKTYLDFATVVLGDSRTGQSPKPFNAIFFDQETLEEIFDPDCCAEVGVDAFAELLVRHLLNPDVRTTITREPCGGIVSRILTIFQSNENMPDAWERICRAIHDLDDDDFDWPAYRSAVERRLEYLLAADGFIPVCACAEVEDDSKGGGDSAYFIPFRFVGNTAEEAHEGVKVCSLDGKPFLNSSWDGELKFLPVEITDDVQMGFCLEENIAWYLGGSSLLLPITLAWWRKTGKLHWYNHFRLMATGRFDKERRLREVDVPAKERAFALGVKGGRLLRPGNGNSSCEIRIGASVGEVFDRVRDLTSHTASSLLKILESRWLDPVTAYKSLPVTGIGCRVIERLMTLKSNAWCAVINTIAFKVGDRMSEAGLSFLKTILGFSNSATGGCVLIKIPESTTQEKVLCDVKDVLRDAGRGFIDVNGHRWICRRNLMNDIPQFEQSKSYSKEGEVLALTIAPSRRPYVLHRDCRATCEGGGTVPLSCLRVCKRTEAEGSDGEWSIPDLLKDWGIDGVSTRRDILGDVLDADERVFDSSLFASIESIRQQGWQAASDIWSKYSAMSCSMLRSRVLWGGNRARLFLLDFEDARKRRRIAAEILLNDLRLHTWGTPVPVIVRVDQDDVDNWGASEWTAEDRLIQLLERDYPAGEFPVRTWRELLIRRLLVLVVIGDAVKDPVAPGANHPIGRMVKDLLRIVNNDLLWVGKVPCEVRQYSAQFDIPNLQWI